MYFSTVFVFFCFINLNWGIEEPSPSFSNCEFDLLENNLKMLEYLPEDCKTLYDNRLTDPNYLKSKQESLEFQKFDQEMLKLETITYDADDVFKDTISVDFEKRQIIYGDKKIANNVYVLDQSNQTCVEEYKDYIGLPNVTDCTVKINIIYFEGIESLCDNAITHGDYYDCRASERKTQLLRFDKLSTLENL
ncbi:hypothetical protein ACFFRR_000104 [Megaselia abdita]